MAVDVDPREQPGESSPLRDAVLAAVSGLHGTLLVITPEPLDLGLPAPPPRTPADPAAGALDGDPDDAEFDAEDDDRDDGKTLQVEIVAPSDLEPGASRTMVLLVAREVTELRRLTSFATRIGRSRRVGVLVLDAERAIVPRVHPSWPRVAALDATVRGGVAVTWLFFSERVPVDRVLLALGRGAAPRLGHGPAGVRLAMGTDQVPPPVDYTLRTEIEDASERPPDVVLGLAADAPGLGVASEVTGHPPVVIATEPSLEDDLLVGPIDEAVFNPRLFRNAAAGDDVDLPPGELTPQLAGGLAGARSVRIDWPADERVVAGLAMCGLPLVCPTVPPASRARLGAALADALDDSTGVALDHRPTRQRHSIRLRRAALGTHASGAWRGRVAARAGVRAVSPPSVGGLNEHTDLVVVGAEPGPDLLSDLLLARAYSGADLVGPALGPGDKRAESFTAPRGDTVLVDRALLRRLDAPAAASSRQVAVLAVRAGAVVYTIHGLADA